MFQSADFLRLFTTLFLIVIGLMSWSFHALIEQWMYKAKTARLYKLQKEKVQELYRFAELGRLSSGLFHDLNNLLTNINLNLELITMQTKGEKDKHAELIIPLQRTVESVRRLEEFTRAVRQQLKKNSTVTEFDILPVITQIVEVLHYKAREMSVNIEVDIEEDTKLFGNALKFGQVMTNLLSNSIDAYDGVQTTKRVIRVTSEKQKDQVSVSVSDDGGGIKKSDLDSIFEPFFSTKTIEKGTGIGLTISRDIMEKDFKGSISIDSQINQGTTVQLTFPTLLLASFP